MAAKNAATAQQQPIDSGRPWFPVSAGLLTRKHYERLGAAWMVFLWFVHQQYAPRNGEADSGMVRNGATISYPEIADALGIPPGTVRRHVASLEKQRYIRSEVVVQGKLYWVMNPLRWSLTHSSKSSARASKSGDLFPTPPQPEVASACSEVNTPQGDTLLRSEHPACSEVSTPLLRVAHPNKEARTTNNTQELNPSSELRSDTERKPAGRARGKPKEPSPDAVALANELRAEIRSNKPDFRVTDQTLAKWAQSADLMLERDGRSPPQVSALIRWVQRDDFWKSNVLSMDKLREKFDQLEMKMQQPPRKGGSNGNGNGKRDLGEYLENEMRIAHEYAARTGR